MELEEYVAARYGRLIEHAVLLGAPEGEAGTYVDRVLLEQRRAIRRRRDPDPVVFAALERSLSGERPRPRTSTPLVALAVVVVVVVVAAVLIFRSSPGTVPSLFGLTGPEAQQLLTRDGFDVLVRPSRACEPADQVVTSDPVPGSLVDKGGTVTVWTAVPSGSDCEAHFGERTQAWSFVRFALGYAAPDFAPTVHVVLDGADVATLSQADAGLPQNWERVLTDVAQAAQQTPSTATGMPDLTTTTDVPPDAWCGVPRPASVGDREALRLEIDPTPVGGGCPLTVDLYTSTTPATGDEQLLDTVVVYTAKQ